MVINARNHIGKHMTFSHIIWMSLKGNWLIKQSIVRLRCRNKIHDKNSPDARRGGTEGCYCKIHILLITWFNITWRQTVVSVNVYTLNPKGNHIPSLIICAFVWHAQMWYWWVPKKKRVFIWCMTSRRREWFMIKMLQDGEAY